MGDEEEATLDGQFYAFSKLFEEKGHKLDGTTITLYRSDYWMRQAKLLNDRDVTMTDTGLCFFKFEKSHITFDEWLLYLTDLCEMKGIDEEKAQEQLINCGLPGTYPVQVPQYRDFFNTFKPKEKGVY